MLRCGLGDYASAQEGGQSCLVLSKMQTQTANPHDFLNQIVSLTIMVPVPRYRLAAGGRSPKNLRTMTSYVRPPEAPIESKHKQDKGRF
jgi:hypothetical protein